MFLYVLLGLVLGVLYMFLGLVVSMHVPRIGVRCSYSLGLYRCSIHVPRISLRRLIHVPIGLVLDVLYVFLGLALHAPRMHEL